MIKEKLEQLQKEYQQLLQQFQTGQNVQLELQTRLIKMQGAVEELQKLQKEEEDK